jgi:hypothetical protein
LIVRARIAASFVVAVLATSVTALADDPEWGIQLGGPAFAQFMFRPRIAGPLRLELGALPLFTGGGVWNASAGLYVEILRKPNWEPYVAAGAAAGQTCGEDVERARLVCSTIYFASTRFGAALGVGEDRQNRITIDAGAWYGKVNPADDEPKTFLIPMGGVGFYW